MGASISRFLSDDRLEEIHQEIVSWVKEQIRTNSRTELENVAKKIDINVRTLDFWLYEKARRRYPSVDKLINLWKATLRSPFLLSKEERALCFKKGGQFPPEREYPVRQEVVTTDTRDLRPEMLKIINHNLISATSAIFAVEKLIKEMRIGNVSDELKKKAVALILKLFSTFNLTANDFQQTIGTEDIEMTSDLGKVLKTLFGKGGE